MKLLKQKLAERWAQARGVRWDVVAGRIATGLGIVGGLSQYVGWIPGRTGAVVAVVCVVCAGLSPRVTKAAGLLKTAYGQQAPLLKVLPSIVRILLAGPSIAAEAKAAEASEARAQAQAADDERIIQRVQAELTKLGLRPGTSRDSLSEDIPASLKAALENALPPDEKSPALTAAVTVEDKIPEEAGTENAGGGNIL